MALAAAAGKSCCSEGRRIHMDLDEVGDVREREDKEDDRVVHRSKTKWLIGFLQG